MVKLFTTFLKFTEFIRETAQKVNISELEGMSTLTSPRVNIACSRLSVSVAD